MVERSANRNHRSKMNMVLGMTKDGLELIKDSKGYLHFLINKKPKRIKTGGCVFIYRDGEIHAQFKLMAIDIVNEEAMQQFGGYLWGNIGEVLITVLVIKWYNKTVSYNKHIRARCFKYVSDNRCRRFLEAQ